MKNILRFMFVFLSMLSLSACVSREQADAKLAKGCAAGVASLLPDGETLGAIENTKATDSPEGHDFRHLTITVKHKDGFLEDDQTYECTFEEDFGFMNMNYTGSIYQLKIGDKVYGKAGNEILGTAEDFLKLTDAIRKAMYDNP